MRDGSGDVHARRRRRRLLAAAPTHLLPRNRSYKFIASFIISLTIFRLLQGNKCKIIEDKSYACITPYIAHL